MRLLNVDTLEFAIYHDEPPPYAIASHRWRAGEEATFLDVQLKQNTASDGYRKVLGFVAYVKQYLSRLKWIWIDTCCIDKRDPQEVSEAINSMFKWYRRAAICVALLQDVNASSDLDAFENSEWFQRGWTLQELLAPRLIVFVTPTWDLIGHKGVAPSKLGWTLEDFGISLEQRITKRTTIPQAILHDYANSEGLSREDKLVWKTGRVTTREEDMAYCLFGILDVAIGANYGEGKEKAERRMYQAIAMETPLYKALTTTPHAMMGSKSPDRMADPKGIAQETRLNNSTRLFHATTVPFPRDRDFIDRGSILDTIAQKLSIPGARIALVGLGGVGKSQLAIEFSYRYRDRFADSWVLWIYSGSTSRFEQSARDFACIVKIPGARDPTVSMLRPLRDWLWDVRNGKWLVILDGTDNAEFLLESNESANPADDFALFSTFPVCEHGSILVTSRDRKAAERLVDARDTIEITPMTAADAFSLLNRKLESSNTDRDESDLRELAESLDYMPLAMTQAVAFLRRRGRRYSVRRYLDDLQTVDQSKQGLLDHDNGDLRRDPKASNSIILTWQISFEHIAKARKSAADLLSLMSLCDRNAIPESLIRGHQTADTTTDFDLEEDIETLLAFSFISLADDEKIFEMHRLVQLATRKWLDSQNAVSFQASRLIEKLHGLLPTPGYTNWTLYEAIFPHVIGDLIDMVPQERTVALQWATVMSNSAVYAANREDVWHLEHAVEMGRRSMELRQDILGHGDAQTLQTMSDLSWTHNLLGNLTEAIYWGQVCLLLQQGHLGTGHRDTLRSMNQLALYHDTQGNSQKALQTGESCWQARKALLGERHSATLTSMNNLAFYCMHTGDGVRAKEMGLRCWQLRQETLGDDHPDTLTSVNSYAYFCSFVGDHKQALSLWEECLRKSETIHGQEHPRTLLVCYNLATSHSWLQQFDMAIILATRCWKGRKKAYGEDHSETLRALGELAAYYDRLGDVSNAVELGMQHWKTRKATLGEKHHRTLASMHNLACFYDHSGSLDEAIALMNQCVELKIMVSGEESPETLVYMRILATFHEKKVATESSLESPEADTGSYSLSTSLTAPGKGQLDGA